ncbi:MAG TPA: hypothetical protein VFS34_06460 [Thermoanaerobaculia bacterium]|nr:hypothetical protein [Thermoanaerobaculia bacterium]
MKADTYVVVYLHSPRERWWGLLRAVTPAGATLRGLSLESFEPWARSVARGEDTGIAPTTVFFPIHRIERIDEDESTLSVASHADRFHEWTGEDVKIHLVPDLGETQ